MRQIDKKGKLVKTKEKLHIWDRYKDGPHRVEAVAYHLERRRTYMFSSKFCSTLRKHAHSIILKFLPPKNENFQMKISDNFHISAQNIDCGYSLEPPRRGGSNEYPQSMFLSRDKKNNVYPCKPQFYYIKVGFKGVKII